MKAKIRGAEIYFDVTGGHVEIKKGQLIEKPVLFLLHGGPGGNHQYFRSALKKLENVAQLVFFDQRGCGWSKKGRQSDYTLENNIEDVEALRKYLGLNKICVLGQSYGGMVAQGYAIRYGKNLKKLILSATAPSHHFLDEARETLNKVGSKEQIDFCNKHLWNGKFTNDKQVEHYFKIMEPLYYSSRRRIVKVKKTSSPELKNVFSREALNEGFSDFLHHYNFIPKLKKIPCPTLIMAGEDDWICSPNQAKVMARQIPDAKLKVFKNCSHILACDAPDLYVKTITGFLNK
jgi:proline iminopeptidase